VKLAPDERLSDQLKADLLAVMQTGDCEGVSMVRRLWFMGRPLPVRQTLVRLWRTGSCKFSDVAVNEHPMVQGRITNVASEMAHHDSPDLDHWLEKQNRYTTAEAVSAYTQSNVSDTPDFFGTPMQRRMWLKVNFHRFPGRYGVLFFYHWLVQGAWRAGQVGLTWCRLRVLVMRLIEYKWREMELTGCMPVKRFYGPGKPDARVKQYPVATAEQ